MTVRRLILVVWLWGCLQSQAALGCRYTVRETGFADLGIAPYRLYGYVRTDTAKDVISSFEQAASAELAQTNTQFELVNVDWQKEHPAIAHLGSIETTSFPTAVLVSPDGQRLPVNLKGPGQFAERLRSAIMGVLSSPMREQIVRQVVETYGVVLLIEGADEQQNARAKDAAAGAIERVAAQMDSLPKPIGHPPKLVVVDSKSRGTERVLLWSLGLDAEKIEEPCAAILYGRARWIGPLFKGGQITEGNLLAVLFVIGDNCECGLDREWLQGTMLPARWDREVQQRVAESLGYDPENPIVKMEMASILGRGSSSYPGVPFGYQELVIETEPNVPVKPATSSGSIDGNAAVTEVAKPAPEQKPVADLCHPIRAMAYAVIGFTALVVTIGMAIALRPRRI